MRPGPCRCCLMLCSPPGHAGTAAGLPWRTTKPARVSGTRPWSEAGRHPAAVLRGGQLALARDWAADPVNRDSLGTLTGAFVDAGTAQERLQQAAERNRTRRLRRLVAALTVLVIVTFAL